MQKSPACYDAARRSLESRKDMSPQGELYLHVFAPVLLAYVVWVLREAEASGVRRLYFLARDGYPMYVAAKELCGAWGLTIECRYLYVSRFSVRQAEYALLGEDCVRHICDRGIDVTFSKVMQRAGLSEEEGRRTAEELGYGKRYGEVLDYRELDVLRERLRASEYFLACVYRRSKEAYPAAMGYFAQEGLLDDVPYALVDSGWIGTLQLSMEHLLRTEKSGIRLRGYYFGMYEFPAGARGADYHTYYFSPVNGLRRKVYFSNCLFETVLSAPHGMTEGYHREEGGYVPSLKAEEGQNTGWMRENAALLVRYAREFVLSNGRSETCRAMEKMAEGLLVHCMGRPSAYEVGILGDLYFSDDVRGNGIQPVAAHLSAKELREGYFLARLWDLLGIRRNVIHESAWTEGSIVRAGRAAGGLWHAALYKYPLYIRKWIRCRAGKMRKQ